MMGNTGLSVLARIFICLSLFSHTEVHASNLPEPSALTPIPHPLRIRSPTPFESEDSPTDPIVRCWYWLHQDPFAQEEYNLFELKLAGWHEGCDKGLVAAIRETCEAYDRHVWSYMNPSLYTNSYIGKSVCVAYVYVRGFGPKADEDPVWTRVLKALECIAKGRLYPEKCYFVPQYRLKA